MSFTLIQTHLTLKKAYHSIHTVLEYVYDSYKITSKAFHPNPSSKEEVDHCACSIFTADRFESRDVCVSWQHIYKYSTKR